MKTNLILGFVFLQLLSFTAHADAVVTASPWGTKLIDNETHRDNPNLEEGSYTDIGASWRTSERPYMINGQSRYLSQWEGRMQRRGTAYWRVLIPRTGWYKIEASYKQSVNRTHDADYAIYVNTKIDDMENYQATPAARIVVDQYGESTIKWADLKVHCLAENDISIIALDGRDDNYSDSADAGRWTFVGEEYNAEKCGVNTPVPVVAPVNSFLLGK